MATVGVTLRAITDADAPLIASLHARSWRSAYRGILADAYLDGAIDADRLATWTARLADRKTEAVGVVAERDGDGVGFVYAYPDHDAVWGMLVDNLHVLPEARGTGLGRRLMQAVAATAIDRLHLWVFEANHDARAFYARIGGREVEHVHKPAPDGGLHPEWRVAWHGDALNALRQR